MTVKKGLLLLSAQLLLTLNSNTAIAQDTESNFKMSLSTAITFALDNNPDLKMAEERMEQMGHFTEEAKSNYWPQMEVEFKGGRQAVAPTNGSSNNNYWQAALRVNQTLFDGYKTTSEVKRRESMTQASMYEALAKENAIILDTVKYYLSVLRYQKEVKVLNEFNAELEKIVNNINEMYNAGAVSKVMNDYALSRHAAAQVDLKKALSSVNDAKSKLEFLTGALPDFEAYTPDELTPENYDFELFYNLAETSHVSLKLNQEEREALEHQLNVEKSGYFPDVNFNVSAEQKNNDGGDIGPSSDVKAYVSLKYNLFDGFLKERKVNRVSSQIKETDYKNDKMLNDIEKNLKLLYFQMQSSAISRETVKNEIKNNFAVKMLNQENFRLGNINAIELIESEERLKDALLKKVKLGYDLYLSKYSLVIVSTLLDTQYFCASCPKIELANKE